MSRYSFINIPQPSRCSSDNHNTDKPALLVHAIVLCLNMTGPGAQNIHNLLHDILQLLLASYPEERRAWYTLRAHVLGDPRKNWGNLISSYIRPFTVHITVRPRQVTMETQLVATKEAAHAHAMCTRPFLLLKGPGYEAKLSHNHQNKLHIGGLPEPSRVKGLALRFTRLH